MKKNELETRINKRMGELKKIRDNCVSRGSKCKYNLVIAELSFLLQDDNR